MARRARTSHTARRILPPAILLAGLGSGWLDAPAQAQFDIGMFWPGYQTPEVVQSINRRAEIRTGIYTANQLSKTHTAAPRAPRDVTFFERYDPETRRAMEDRVARRPSRPQSPTPTTPAAVPTILPALDSFFDRYDQVVWPIDAPTDGDLLPKRRVSDEASRATLLEYRKDGLAKVATTTESRNALLTYGRPALQFMRTQSPATAESFHRFLLSLYDALGRAATAPRKAKP